MGKVYEASCEVGRKVEASTGETATAGKTFTVCVEADDGFSKEEKSIIAVEINKAVSAVVNLFKPK